MTAQVHERLILDGELRTMTFCPDLPEPWLLVPVILTKDSYSMNGEVWTTTQERWWDPYGGEHRISRTWCSIESEEEDADLVDLEYVGSTACWRGYVGTWRIEDRRFYLDKLIGRVRLAVESPLFADWFTGVLRIPDGKVLMSVHMGFGTLYEQEIHIFVEEGHVRGRRTITNSADDVSEEELEWANLPGFENRFKGDRDFH
jgi:hypothetical protein